MAIVEQLLDTYCCGEPQPLMPAVVLQLKRASENYLRVVPHIHDLWSELAFRRACAAGLDWLSLPQYKFLKPLDQFSSAELGFEQLLAAMDLRTLALIASQALTMDDLYPVKARDADALHYDDDPHAVNRALVQLATNESFLRMATTPLHKNWLRAIRLLSWPDSTILPTSTVDHSAACLDAVRADMLAVLLFSVLNDSKDR
jgi:hypothetical protein